MSNIINKREKIAVSVMNLNVNRNYRIKLLFFIFIFTLSLPAAGCKKNYILQNQFYQAEEYAKDRNYQQAIEAYLSFIHEYPDNNSEPQDLHPLQMYPPYSNSGRYNYRQGQ